MVAPEAKGKGIGERMAELFVRGSTPPRLHRNAVQLRCQNNIVAVRLWQKIGFEIIGEIPEAFNHSKLRPHKRLYNVPEIVKSYQACSCL